MKKRARMWLDQLHTAGEVTIGPARSRMVVMLLLTIGFTALGGLFLWAGLQDGFEGALVHPGFWIGLLTVGFFGIIGIPSLLIQAVRGRTLTVTRQGLTMRPSPAADPELEVAWSEVREVGIATMNGSSMVVVRLTPDAFQRSLRTRAQRALVRVNAALVGEHGFALPTSFQGGAKAQAQFLGAVHGEFWERESQRFTV